MKNFLEFSSSKWAQGDWEVIDRPINRGQFEQNDH